MRRILFVFLVLAGAATFWHAATAGAAAIEADIDRRARAALTDLSPHPIGIETDGQFITLTGLASSADERAELIAVAEAVRGSRVVIADIEVLPEASPYEFAAVKAADGSVTLSGHVPTEAMHRALVTRAARLAGATDVSDGLTLAAGAPDGDWRAMTEAALAALAPLDAGTASLADTEGHVVGTAPSAEALDAAAAALDAAPDVEWETELRLALDDGEPFRLDAERPPLGPLLIDGHAPDAEARDRLAGIAETIGGAPPEGRLLLAEPAPAEGWTDVAAAALELLGRLPGGQVAIRDGAVTVSGTVDSDPDADALRASGGEDWTFALAVRNPDPPARLTLSLGRDGGIAASGLLPRGMDGGDLRDALPGASIGSLEGDGRGDPGAWRQALAGFATVMPRLREAEVSIFGTEIVISGTLHGGFNAEEARSAIRTSAGPAWTVVFDVSEAPPEAVLALVIGDRGREAAGILPADLDANEVARTLGLPDDGLASVGGGGEGNAAQWRRGLAALARLAPLSATLEATLRSGVLEASGALRPGYDAAAVADLVAEAAGPDWQLALLLADTAPADGDVRVSLATGETEEFTSGHWLPRLEFEPVAATCDERAQDLLSGDGITFVTGSTEIDAEAAVLLNRLAAVALRCLGEGTGRLVIGGHTDDVGEDRANLILSRDRADAVAAALADRGVAPEALIAVGYGTFRPVADNDTPEGRALNRRITFAFIR